MINRSTTLLKTIFICTVSFCLQLVTISAKAQSSVLDLDLKIVEQAESIVDSAPNKALELITPILTREAKVEPTTLAHAYWIKARAHSHKSEYAKSIKSGRFGLAQIGEGNPVLRANILEAISLAMTRSNDTRHAYDLQQEALSIRKQQNDQKGQADSLAILAEIYFDVGQHEKSRIHYKAALSQARLSENNYSIIRALNNYAFSLLIGNEAAEALQLLKEAETLSAEIENPRVTAFVNQNIGHALVRLERFDEAEPFVLAALQYAQVIGSKELLTGIYLTLSRIEKHRGRLKAAREYALLALPFARDVGYKERISDLHLLLSQIDFEVGRIDRAYAYLDEHVKHLTDVSYSSMNRSASLFAAHEELLEKNIELELSKKEAKIALLEVARARNIRNGAIIVTCSFLLLLIGTIWILREKIYAKRTLEKANAELTSAYAEIELANSAKSKFISVMSHELRTPLNSVIGFSDIIEGEKLGPIGRDDYVSFARQINEQGAKLLRMVEDILLLSDTEAEKWDVKNDSYRISEIFKAAQQQVFAQNNYAVKRLEYFDETENDFIQCNYNFLCRAVSKILDNALKFTTGNVEVISSNTNPQEVTLTIIDEGPGFDERHVGDFLEPFRQADDSRIRTHEGAGLGLSVANLIVKLHDGFLNIKTQEMGRTSVSITLSTAVMNAKIDRVNRCPDSAQSLSILQ